MPSRCSLVSYRTLALVFGRAALERPHMNQRLNQRLQKQD